MPLSTAVVTTTHDSGQCLIVQSPWEVGNGRWDWGEDGDGHNKIAQLRTIV